MNDVKDIQARLLTLRVVWGAICASVGVLGATLFVVTVPPVGETLLPLLLAAQIPVVALGIGVVRVQQLGPRLGLWPADVLRAEAAPREEALRAAAAALPRYFSGTVVGLALAESVAVLGFVSSYLTGDLAWFSLHAACAGALLAVQVPRFGGLLALLEPGQAKALLGPGAR